MSRHPNIVLVTVDSLRADRCGVVPRNEDGTGGLMPTLDRLGRNGLVFENAITPGPATPDAMPVLFTGEPIHARGTWDGDAKKWISHHMRAHDTLPERLSRLGYETGAFTANPWTSRYFDFDEGFDHFEDFLDTDQSQGWLERGLLRGRRHDGETTIGYALQLLADWIQESNMFQSWGSYYDDAVAWTEQASEPYFLWLFLVDVHMPYLPPADAARGFAASRLAANLWLYLGAPKFESVIRDSLVRSYDDTVQYVDSQLDRLLDDLADDDPIYVVHSDHGEEFGEHGVYGHGPHLYEEQIHTPLVVGNGPTGRIERPISLERLPDLVTGLARGEDVTGLAERVVTTRNWDPTFAACAKDWKYIRTTDSEKLYELPAERELKNEELLALGRDVVDAWRSDLEECERLFAAGRKVADEKTL